MIKIKKLLRRLQLKPQSLNDYSLMQYIDIIYFSVGILLSFRLINNMIQQEHMNVIFDSIGLLMVCFLNCFKKDPKKSHYCLLLIFWIITFISIIDAYFIENNSLNSQARNIWVYESIVSAITPLMSQTYQIIHRIIFHTLNANIAIKSYDENISLVIEIIFIIIMVIFNITMMILKINHTENEFYQKNFYEDLLNEYSEASFKITKNSQNQIVILKSNRDDIKTYQHFIDVFTRKNLGKIYQIFYQKFFKFQFFRSQKFCFIFANQNQLLVYENDLPYNVTNLFNLIEKQLNCKSSIIKHKVIATSNKGQINEKIIQIDILKLKENFQNIIFLIIRDLDFNQQKQQELIKTREMIFDLINHDIKNPLISGCFLTKNLIKQFKNADSIIYSDLIKLQSYFNKSLFSINGYFDFTLTQIKNLKIQPESFDLYKSIKNTIKMMQYEAQKQSVHLISQLNFKVISYDYQKKIFAYNDSRRFQSVLMNLIDNAIKFSLKKQQVKVEFEEFFQQNLVYINVIDFGVGISPQTLDLLSKPFVTCNTNGMNSHGSGIGLFTSLKIVGQIGPLEKLFISSVQNQGTQISFLMYLNAQDDQIKPKIQSFNYDLTKILFFLRNNERIVVQIENESEILIAEEKRIDQQKIEKFQHFMFDLQSSIQNNKKIQQNQILNIMIVDDEEMIRLATSKAINKLGIENYQIYQAENGLIALQLFKKYNQNQNDSTIDLIITDIQMPVLNGYQMVEQINHLVKNHNYQKAEIIVISSDVSNQYNENCRALNIYQNFSKPQNAQQIREIIINFEKKKVDFNQFKARRKDRYFTV